MERRKKEGVLDRDQGRGVCATQNSLANAAVAAAARHHLRLLLLLLNLLLLVAAATAAAAAPLRRQVDAAPLQGKSVHTRPQRHALQVAVARALDGASQPMRALSLQPAEHGGAALRFAASHEPLLNDLIRQLRSERSDAAAVTLSTPEASTEHVPVAE